MPHYGLPAVYAGVKSSEAPKPHDCRQHEESLANDSSMRLIEAGTGHGQFLRSENRIATLD